MRKILLCLVGFLFVQSALGQKENEVVVGPGKKPSKVFPAEKLYRLPEFQNGYVVTYDGKRSQQLKLNFDLLEGLPLFINEKSDTLFLDEHLAEYVQFGGITYFHETGRNYYELISHAGGVKLGIVKGWRIARIQKLTQEHRVGSGVVDTGRDGANLIYSPDLQRMVRNENTVYERDSSFYFVKPKSGIYKATRKGIVRLFTNQKSKIEDYIDQKSISFDNRQALIELLQFCNNL
jgi:hypothetical protein